MQTLTGNLPKSPLKIKIFDFSYIFQQNSACSMKTCQFLQRQYALLKIQPCFLKLNMIATVSDFLHHQAIGWNVKDRNDTKMIDIVVISYITFHFNVQYFGVNSIFSPIFFNTFASAGATIL